jgi:hypothetical protein
MKKISLSLLVIVAIIANTNTFAQKKTEISHGEKAYIALQVQNVMSKHEYYHAAGMHIEEINDLWVAADGPNAESATFASPAWVMQGISTIMAAYGQSNQDNRWRALKKINEIYPEIEITKENLGAGNEYPVHMSTTPVIEVAGDGKTAKGVWYSPGYSLSVAIDQDGKVGARGIIFYEKYGADFILEDGVWKMWHCQMAYDFTPGMDQPWLDFDAKVHREAGETEEGQEQMKQAAGGPGAGAPPAGGPGPGGPGGPGSGLAVKMGTPEYSYPTWSPKRPGLIYPKLPEPYYTFSETFSY